MKIENETYTNTNKQTDYIKLFDKYFEASYSSEYVENIIPEFDELKNLVVPITILYAKYNEKTIKSLEYKINPK